MKRETEPLERTLRRVWARARALAETYWRGLTNDSRISSEFQAISRACLQALDVLPRTGAYA